MRLSWSAAGVILLLGGTALAQAPKKPALDRGAARAEATALIQKAQVSDLFVAGASPAGPLVQHVKSNMVCHFEPGSKANQIKVFDSGPGRGDDVGCGTQFEDVTSSIFAVRAKGPDDVVKTETQTLADFQRQFPDVVPYKGPVTTIKDKNRPPMAVSRQTTARGQRYLRATAFRIGAWVYSQTIIAPTASAAKADQYAEIQLSKLVEEVRRGRPN